MNEPDPQALRRMLDDAAEMGARRALAHLGLQNIDAAVDLKDLRALLEAWRDAKRTMRRTAVRWLTTFVLVGLAAWAGAKLRLFGG